MGYNENIAVIICMLVDIHDHHKNKMAIYCIFNKKIHIIHLYICMHLQYIINLGAFCILAQIRSHSAGIP